MTTKKKAEKPILTTTYVSSVDISDAKTTREKLLKLAIFTPSPERKYEIAKKLIEKFNSKGEKLTAEEMKSLFEIAKHVNTTRHHRMLAEIPRDDGDRTAIMEFTDDLIQEHDCNTVMERSLCETIAASYYGIMRASKGLQSLYHLEYLSNEKNGYYGLMSKDLERQNRIYLNAIMTLRALKSPSINLSIKANTAIFGQNQQFNDNRELPGTQE